MDFSSLAWRVFVGPSVYLFLATLSLLQFSLAFNALTSAVAQMGRNPALDAFAPVLKSYLRFLEDIFGPAYKYSPSPVDVTLVAVMLVIMLEVGRR